MEAVSKVEIYYRFHHRQNRLTFLLPNNIFNYGKRCDLSWKSKPTCWKRLAESIFLYISQVKQSVVWRYERITTRQKSENTKQPQCSKEKEDAIVEALKHFQMI